MPKISLHVEADSAEEYLAILAAIRPPLLLGGQHTFPQAQTDATPLTPIQQSVIDGTFGVKSTDEREEAVEEPSTKNLVDEAAPEKPARKPRGPNKPKMTPVTVDAPQEEDEHVGTVAVGPSTNGQADPSGEILTRSDLGDTIAGYVRKYGINFAQVDVSKLLQDNFGPDVRKKSDVPEDQPSLRKAISLITQATVDNPYNRKVDVNG